MWTIVGGILLAILAIFAIPYIIAAASIALTIALSVGAVAVIIYYPAESVVFAIGVVALMCISVIWATYKNSRNWSLFLAELRLKFLPALSLHATAVKEVQWEEHRQAVSSYRERIRGELIEESLAAAEALASKVWRRYRKHGMISAHRTENKVSFLLNEDTHLFSIGASSNFPNHPDQMYALNPTGKTYDKGTKYLKNLKSSMRSNIKNVLLEKEREIVRAKAVNE